MVADSCGDRLRIQADPLDLLASISAVVLPTQKDVPYIRPPPRNPDGNNQFRDCRELIVLQIQVVQLTVKMLSTQVRPVLLQAAL